MSASKPPNLSRRQALRRKGYSWRAQHETESTHAHANDNLESKQQEKNGKQHCSHHAGSSVDLSPALLGIYDSLLCVNENTEPEQNHRTTLTNQSEEPQFNRQIPHSDQIGNNRLGGSLYFKEKSCVCESEDEENKNLCRPLFKQIGNIQKPEITVDWDNDPVEVSIAAVMMETGYAQNLGVDSKKRPLSISSTSSSSTASLPRSRKRPNLSDCADFRGSTGPSDIEKLDSLLYIDEGVSSSAETLDDEHLEGVLSKDGGGFGLSSAATCSAPEESPKSQGSNPPISPASSPIPVHGSDSSNCDSPEEASRTKVDKYPQDSTSKGSHGSFRSRSCSSSVKSSGHYVSYVQRVVAEIVDTERLYVQHLQDIKEGYLEYLVNNPSVGFIEEGRNCLFGNINNIYNFSRQFLGELEKCNYDPIKVAECFVLNNNGFVIYADYCTNYPVAVSVLTRVMQDQQLSEVFKQRQIALGHSLPLGAYLLKPVQRILKYHLLLQNILKHYKESESGYEKLAQALKHMTSMAQHINEMKRKHEHAVRVQEIQSQLEDYRGEDFTCLGELVLEGSFRMYGAKASRQMFLFEKGVIIAKRKEDGMLSCKTFIPCATLMLVESLPREPLNFQILPFDNPRGAHTIHARNLEQKRKWCQEIKRLILESYKSKIPEKVKDLIMQQLGKSKEEENFVKAGNADSVKGHHATPDYLERRQRMRRKSGSNLIPEILRPQKTKKTQQQRSRDESISPRASPLVERVLREAEISPGRSQNNSQAYHIYRTSEAQPRQHHEFQEHTSVSKKLPSIARSQSFQLATIKNPMNSLDLENPPSPLDKYLSNSEGVQRSHSFRTAVETQPVEFGSDFNGQCVVNMEKQFQENKENEQNVRNIDSSDNAEKVVMINDKIGESNSLGRQGRYASMPVLNETQTSGRLACSPHHSDPRADGLSIGHDVLPLASPIQTRRIDLKPYFTVTKPQAHHGSPKSERPTSDGLNLSRDQSSVTAFHDKFSSVRKFSENLGARVLEAKITLTQPKPFSSTVKLYDSVFGSQAKLTKKNVGERFTKGSLVDLSHLKEDPWVRKSANCRLPSKPDTKEDHTGLLVNRRESGHHRTHSLSVEDTSFSRENLDWLVYATRNSLPMDRLNNRQYKYCTPPRGEMVPPTTSHLKSNTETLYLPPSYGKMESVYSTNGDSAEDVGSSSSLSATTSSETCSSPDVLQDTLFHDPVTPRPSVTQSRKHLSRSNSSPETRQIFPTKSVEEDSRPASMDVHVRHLEDSDKLVAEMEDYIRNSSSSSSLSSTNKFPPTIPSLEPSKPRPKSKKSKIRHSYKSDDSLSSYDESENPQHSPDDDTLVGTIKNKFHNITSKLKKASSPECEDEQSSQGKHVSNSKNTNLYHTYSLKARTDHVTPPGKKKDPDLTTLLREGEPGSRVIGSRMANPDFDDYADLSLPKMTPSDKFKPTPDLPKEQPSLNFKEAESSGLQFSLGSPDNSVTIQQSDSAFSIRSIDEDSSSPDGSPHQEFNGETSKPTAETRDKEEEDSGETFYEKRLSQALDDEDAFRDSAVYCDTDTDQPALFPQDCPAPKVPIKRYVQMLEEKQKAILPNTYKVKQREPGLIVRQRLESLLTSCEYNKNTSNSSSHTTSRSTSCTASRATSEERGNILDHFQTRNPSENGQSTLRQEGADYKLVSKARTSSPSATLKSAYSLGRLDKISSDIENLVIMKGWVRQLISRFQTEH